MLIDRARSLGEVRICPCKTMVPLSRNHVFAEIKTTTLTRIGSGEEAWLGPLRLDSSAFGSSGAVVVADDDGTGAGRIEECQEANNPTVIPRSPCDD